MKRRAAEVAAIKLCKASFESRPSVSRSRDGRSSSTADKTRDKKVDSSSGDKPPNNRDNEKTSNRKAESSSPRDKPSSKKDVEKAQEKTDDLRMQPRGRQAAKRKSFGSDVSMDGNRRSGLRSSHPLTPLDNKSGSNKTGSRKKNKKNDSATEHSESSSEADSDDNTSSGTEISQPVKQHKLGIICYLLRFL